MLTGCKSDKIALEDVRELYRNYYEFISDSETQEYFDDFMIAEMYENVYLLTRILDGRCDNPETANLIYGFVDFKYFSHQNLLLNVKDFKPRSETKVIDKPEYLQRIKEAKEADEQWSMGELVGQIGDMEDGYSFHSISFRELDFEDGKIVPISYEERVIRDYCVQD